MAFQLLDPLNLVFLLILTAAALAIGSWVMTPLASTRKPALRWQCHLPDILVLVTQLALAGALVFRIDEELSVALEFGGLAVLWAIMTLWWWIGIRILSRREIVDPRRRFVVLAVLCPMIYSWPLTVVMGNPLFLLIFANILLLIPLLALAVIFKLGRWIANWVAQPASRSPAPGRLVLLRWLGALLICATVTTGATSPLWSGYSVGPVFYRTALRQFRMQMKRRADIPAIQGWLQRTDVTKLNKDGCEIASRDLPECVTSLSDRACIKDDGTLILVWGGGFGHWGLAVAAPGTPMPPQSSREYHLRLADGAWVWHEIQ